MLLFKRKFFTYFVAVCIVSVNNLTLAQFAGAAGTNGSNAIFKDSVIFINWATNCELTRGLQDISNFSLGYSSVGSETSCIGPVNSEVASLGDGGMAILTFEYPVSNGIGEDFAVFENSFNDSFLELAFVEVSSDGINYFRFPAISNTQFQTQIGSFDNVGDPTKINNLAGKYRSNFGTPFNLDDLIGISGINLNAITHVKIVDIIGSINPLYARYDSQNRPINDPFPTPFSSSGFDLEAIGVIHQNTNLSHEENSFPDIKIDIFPNPTSDYLNIQISHHSLESVVIYSSAGSEMLISFDNKIAIGELENGVYICRITTKNGYQKNIKLIKK